MSVTKEEMQAAIDAAVTAATKPLNDKIASLSVAPPPKAQEAAAPGADKIWTKEELRDLIDKGQITEAQAEDRFELQREQRIRKAVMADVEQLNQKQTVGQQIDEFIALIPELNDKTSKDSLRAKAQFEALVARGMPKTPATELTAIEMIYGTVNALRTARGARSEAESHQDGAGDGEPPTGSKSAGKMKYTADEKRYYEDLIGKGIVADWAAADAEMAFKKTRHEKARVH